MKLPFVFLPVVLGPALAGAATYEWTAGGDGVSLFAEANWTLNGDGVTSIPVIDGATPVNHDLVVKSGNPGGGGGGGNDLDLGTGSLTVNAGTFRMNVGNSAAILNGPITLTGGTIICQFVGNSAVELAGGTLSVNGGNNPLNGTTVNFSAGSSGVLLFQDELPADVESEHLGKITVDGSPAVTTGAGQNVLILDEGAAGSRLSLLSNVDEDNDGIPDAVELIYFGDLDQDETTDFDGDGLLDLAELETHLTHPAKPDTDGDGLTDGDEINNRGTNPKLLDSDGDGSPDGLEAGKGTDPSNAGESVSRPNIIFFFVDDLGYGDVGCFWQDQKSGTQKFDTPGIDQMAAEGAKLTHHYISAPVCAPSRASLLNGRHQGHSNVRDSQFDKALENNHTMASVLKQAGYRTIHTGKAGLAGGEGSADLSGSGSSGLAAHPLDRGYDEFFGYLFHGDGHEHYPRNGTTEKTAHIYDGYQQIKNASVDLYTTDAWTAFAKDAIIKEVGDGDEQPFFLYLAYETPHFKMQRPAVAYPAFDNDGDPATGGIQWTIATDTSGNIRYASTADGSGVVDGYNHPDSDTSWPTSNQQHVGMIRRIDRSIADILQTLKDLGIDDNTLCVFSSDNGPHNEGNNPRYFESFANMEGVKRDMWEAGIRVPTVVRWPGKIAGATDNASDIHEIDYPSAIWDWMPTFAEIAGVPAPSWCDGVSLLPTLTGEGTQRDKGYLYFEFLNNGSTPNWVEFPNHRNDPKGQMQCLRIGNLMGIRTAIASGATDFEIYDVTTDPGQGNNLAATLPEVQAQMKEIALRGRRPGQGAARPYDAANIPAVVINAEPGLKYAAYEGFFQWVPELRDLTASASGSVNEINAMAHRSRAENLGLLYEGFINAPADGAYSFSLTTDTGANFFIHDAHLIEDDFTHDGSEKSGTINLQAGLHPFRLYYRHIAGEAELQLSWSGPGFSKTELDASALFREATPSPNPSANHDSASTSRNTAVDIDVLANDLDDGLPGPLSISSVMPPLAGMTEIVGGMIRYTPAAGFIGRDEFTYSITDGDTFAFATVSVEVIFQDPGRLWMPFNQAAGLTTYSASGGVSGSLLGFADSTSHWVDGPMIPNNYGKAIQFDGVGTSVALDSSYLPPVGAEDRTITAWIKTSADGALVAWGPKVGGEKWHWRLEGGRLRIEVEGGFRKSATDLRDGEWHFVALVFEGDDTPAVSDCRLFVDGVEDAPYTMTEQAINTGASVVEIGKDSQSRYFTGVMDEVMIHREALTPAAILALMNVSQQPSAAWHQMFFGDDAPTEAMWLLDDDGDGLSRLAEFALGGNPFLKDASDLAASVGYDLVSEKILITLNERSGGTHNLRYEVEASNDLVDWETLEVSPVSRSAHASLEGFESADYETARDAEVEPRQFVRVKFSLTP
ncbi:sulfatase-like hydrolase/transferase [Verrucomicrobiaceae bacterium 227]